MDFLAFLREYEVVIEIVKYVLLFSLAVLLYRKTGNIKFLKEVYEDMKYRTQNYNVSENVDKKSGEVVTTILRSSQSFSKLLPVYRLNEVTNELEKTTDVIDVSELVESCRDSALNSMLERYLPKIIDETADYTQVKDDLDFLSQTFDVAESYREKLGLSDKLSVQEVFAHMDKYAKELKAKINNKEVLPNEKEIIEEKK